MKGIVRSVQNTKDDSGGMSALCASKQANGQFTDDEEGRCAAQTEGLDVKFGSRSYLLKEYNGSCDSSPLGAGEYGCVDYKEGAMYLSGKTLSVEVDVSSTPCGCNAAFYLVSMPQSEDVSSCGDYYCDANNVCGVECAEIDLIEANQVAFVSTVHVADDGNGDGWGVGHYVIPKEKRLSSADACPYGPDGACTIDTRAPYTASFSFTPADEPFGFSVALTQGGRMASMGPVRYLVPPTKGEVKTAADANGALRSRLDEGMTLVTSYWSGGKRSDMAWLDGAAAQPPRSRRAAAAQPPRSHHAAAT